MNNLPPGYSAKPIKTPSIWSLIGWEAKAFWGGGLGFIIGGWSSSGQAATGLDIEIIGSAIAAFILGSTFAICSVLIKTRGK